MPVSVATVCFGGGLRLVVWARSRSQCLFHQQLVEELVHQFGDLRRTGVAVAAAGHRDEDNRDAGLLQGGLVT